MNNDTVTYNDIVDDTSIHIAKQLQPLLKHEHKEMSQIFSNIVLLYRRAKSWNELSDYQRILLETDWTTTVIKLLIQGNRHIMHSIWYGLREADPEEIDQEGRSMK